MMGSSASCSLAHSRHRSSKSAMSRTTAALLFLLFCGCHLLPLTFAQQDSTSITPIKLYGINYNTRQGPDWDPDRCKSRSQIVSELSLLKQVTDKVRILSCTDCLQGPVVLNVAKQVGLQVWFGLWVSDDPNVIEQELTCLSQIVNQFDDAVLGVSVGSEAIYRKDVTVNQSLSYLQEARQVLSDAGRDDLPVALCEVDDTYTANPRLFRATDIVVANSFPFWEQVDIDGAAEFLVNKLPGGWDVATQYGKDFILGETGWASEGYNKKGSETSPANQAQYFQDFYCLVDKQEDWMYFWFAAFDTPWRLEQANNDNSVEGSFGMFNGNLTLKSNFANLQFSCSGSNEVYGFVLDAVSESIPTPAPSAPANRPSTTSSPTRSPASSSGGGGAASCSANPLCDELGLTGECCPTVDGIFLICCEDAPTLSPATSFVPRDVPTVSPAPVAAIPASNTTTTTTATPSTAGPTVPPDVTIAPTTRLAPTAAPSRTPPTVDITDDNQQGGVPSTSDAPSDVPSRVPSPGGGGGTTGGDTVTFRPSFVVDAGTPPSPFDSTRDGSTSGASMTTITTGLASVAHLVVVTFPLLVVAEVLPHLLG